MRTFVVASVGVAVVMLLACSAFDSEDGKPAGTTTPDTGSSTVDGGGPDDALVAAETLPPAKQECASDKPFSDAQPVPGLPSLVSCFVLSEDESTAYFTQDHVVRAAPWSRATGVGAPVRNVDLTHVTGTIGCTSFTLDESFVFNEDFFFVNRQERLPDGGYGKPVNIPPTGLPEGRFLGHPFVDRVTSDLYVSVVRQSDFTHPPFGIARAIIQSKGATTAFTPVVIGADESIHSPVIAGDSKSIYFSSTSGQATDITGTNQHMWVATRGSTLSPSFENPRPLTELSGSPGGESPTYITRDGCQIFYASTRGTDGGTDRRIWVATRTP